jgi:hypothetical protein
MVEVLHEDLGMIFSFLLLIDCHVAFVMFLLCYAKRPCYLFHILFPSLGILQHYVEFNIHTIVMLQKLFGARSFGGFINHPAHRQAILPPSLGKLNLLFVVWIVTPTFLECWALITPAFVTRFQ